MKIDDVTIPTNEGSQLPTGTSPARPTSLPPECDPGRFLNWRFKYAMHLVDRADGSEIVHKDPWIQAAIDFCITARSKNRVPTETDLAIFAATELWKSDSLAKYGSSEKI